MFDIVGNLNQSLTNYVALLSIDVVSSEAVVKHHRYCVYKISIISIIVSLASVMLEQLYIHLLLVL